MECGSDTQPATLDCLFKVVLPSVLNAAFVLIGIVVVAMIIYGGIRFILSRGDAKQVEGARKIITYAFIGAAVVIFSVFIINFIGTITGVTCIGSFGYTSCK